MSNIVSLGFMPPSEKSIALTQFFYLIDGERFPAESSNRPTWDYETPVRAEAELDVNLRELIRSTGFATYVSDEELPEFKGFISWTSTKTKQRGAGQPQVLKEGKNTFTFEVDGELIGGTLQADVHVVLSKRGFADGDAVVPETLGSRLWVSERVELELEGTASRFTMAPLNFKELGMQPSNAMWRIEMASDLLVPAQAGVRVYINTNHKVALKMLEQPGAPEAKLWSKFLYADVFYQLLMKSQVLSESEEIIDSELFPGSLGESVYLLSCSVFPNEPLDEIALDPTRVAAFAQALAFEGKQ